MVEMFVIKRTGEVVPFDKDRINAAILKAARATGTKLDDKVLEKIVTDVISEVQGRFTDFHPNVENVQDLVEKHLVTNGQYEISKEYILYRAKRSAERSQKQKETMERSAIGKLTVKKRDGRKVIFDREKIKRAIARCAKDHSQNINTDLIIKEVIKNIYDGVTTVELEKALIFATTAFIEKDPSYSWVGGQLFMEKVYKEIIGESVNQETLAFSYRETFVKNISKMVDFGLLDKKLLDFDLDKLSYGMKLERDKIIQFTGIQTLYERYFQQWQKKRLELPQAFWMRVAMGLAINEKDKNEKALEFYEILSTLRFISSTPTLFHSGTTHPQLSSCYLTTVTDDLNHIFKSYGDNAQLSKWSGGIGNDWTNIRATGAWIKTTNVESQGVIPFLKIANDVTAAINRSGKRRGATCAYLETWHLDIEDFLDLRKNTGDDRRRTHDMNTANWIPDLFMKRLLADESWTLFSPEEVPELHETYGQTFEKHYIEYEKKAQNGEIKKHKTIPATKIWRKMISMLFETGHPWFTWKDPCNIRSPQDHVGVIHSSNLCTEITLNTSEDETAVCNLGSVNLAKHMKDGKLDEVLVEKTVTTAIRMLDNVIDICFYPTKEAANSNMRHRPIGLGVMGLQDALFMQDLSFDSQGALEFSDAMMETISYHAIKASSALAKEKGPYESFKGSKWDRGMLPLDTLDLLEEERGLKIDVSREERKDWTPVRAHIKQHGMRNSNVMAIAPTATISTISGCLPCIEPIYKNIYVKANMSGEFTIVNSYLIEDLKGLNMWNEEMLEQLKYYDGNINMIASIPQKLKDKYKEAFDVDPKIHLKHTALRGKWIDQSQSHNVFIKGTSGKLISDVYQEAWKLGIKTTYYLRTLSATQIEKSTLDANKYGFTQKRQYTEQKTQTPTAAPAAAAPVAATDVSAKKACSILDPDCEACQ